MFRRLINSLTDIVYPKTCVVCKDNLKDRASIDGLVCIGCWNKVKKNLPPFCHSCGRRLERRVPGRNICPACIKKPLFFDRAFSACKYEGVIKDLIHAFKYKNKDYLSRTLSRLMVEFIKEYNLPIEDMDFIIPVPLHKTRLREREFNQAEALSSHIAKEFKKDLLTGVLSRHRNTKTQTELAEDKRAMNVKESFSITDSHKIKGRNLLIIDDVMTTGATSSEAALALKKAGAHIVFTLTLAD